MHNKLLLISFYSLILNAFFRPLNSSIATIFGYVTIIASLLYPFFRFRKNGKLLMDKRLFAIICILVISMGTSIGQLSFEGIENQFIAIISFIAFYWTISSNQEDDNYLDVRRFCRANYFLCGVLLLFGYGPFSFKYMVVDTWGNSVFSMGLGNPNVVSVYVMFAIVLLLIHVVYQRRGLGKIIDFILVGLLFYLLILLSSRTVVACVLLLFLGYFIGRRSNKMQFLWVIALAWPVIMIIITLVIGGKSLTFQLLGKALDTGRYGMYSTALSDMKASPISFVFGEVFKYRFTNMHNAPLTIICNIGIVGFICYLIVWYRRIRFLNENCATTVQRIAFYAILAFIIQSSSESLSMIGTIPYAVMVIIIDKIAKGEIDNSSYEKTESVY